MRWSGALLWLLPLWAQTHLYLVHFTEKPDSLIGYPERFLSPDALTRRCLQGIPISTTDLPIPPQWIETLQQYGTVWNTSRWLNAALVELADFSRLPDLPFVRCVEPLSTVRHRDISGTASVRPLTGPAKSLSTVNITQLAQLKIPALHSLGYTGKGIRVAILDAGFPYMDQIPAFQHLFREGRYIAGYDFVAQDSSIFGDNAHGTQVASVIVAHDLEGLGYQGGAPDVSVILARTEDALSESRLEEWNWARAAEWADSLGAYIIQSSLGYSTFDDPSENYTYADMNGRTAITTQAARLAAQKGLLVVSSAGNEGNSPWRYITAPADADSIIAVGAINSSGQIAPFSSRGPTADRRIKPDLVAMGWGTYIVGLSGNVQQASGTSFSAPIITSLAACVWQSAPELPGWAVREALLRSADRFTNPDTIYGYGIPDGEKALAILRTMRRPMPENILSLYPNPTTDQIKLSLTDPNLSWYTIEVYDASGATVLRMPYRGMTEVSISTADWRPGLYFIQLIPQKGKRTFQSAFVKV